MRRVDWNSPARLLEKIIHHEAVHEIDGWDDLRRRLQPDRRCFAFFHPQLPDEPLIFDQQRTAQRFLDRYQRLEDLVSSSENPCMWPSTPETLLKAFREL
jgi:malonyl-CoA decarboxylase